jgi:hypothetical protein
MPTLDLGRVIPLERGTWTTGTNYEFMDSVQYQGSTYVSIFSGSHTAADANKPSTSLGQSTYWRRNARGFDPKGTYNANTAYERDNLVIYGGSVYRCIANTTAGTDPSNGNYWTSFALGIGEYLGEWNSNDTYPEGSIVIWDVDAGNNINGLYRANQPTPQNTPPSNDQYWDVLAAGFVWQGEWATGTAYKYRSVVSYRGVLYLAAARGGVVADQNPTLLQDWTKISDGFKWQGSLESIGSGTSLFYGDVVTFANGLFQVVNSTNGADDPRQTPANFRTLTKFWDWQGTWNNSTVYYLDQTLIYQNSIYRVLGTTTTGQNPDNASSLFQTIIEAPDNFTDYNSATKRLQIRRVTQATNDAATYGAGEPVAIIDGAGAATGSLYIHDNVTAGGTSVGFPSGTRMVFQQTTAPAGWTKDTTHDNKALRIISGTVGTGGNVAFSTAFASQNVGDTTLSINQIPSHNHSINNVGNHGHTLYMRYGGFTGNWDTNRASASANGHSAFNTNGAIAGGGGANINAGNAGGGGGHNHSLDIAVQYVDFIIATKD